MAEVLCNHSKTQTSNPPLGQPTCFARLWLAQPQLDLGVLCCSQAQSHLYFVSL